MADQVVVKSNTNSSAFGITALVTGISGVVFAWVPFFGLALGVVGVVFGALGMKRSVARGMSIAGLVTGSVAVLIGLLVIIFWIFAIAVAANDPNAGYNSWNY